MNAEDAEVFHFFSPRTQQSRVFELTLIAKTHGPFLGGPSPLLRTT